MENQMNKSRGIIWFTLIVLIVVAAILAGIWASLSFNYPFGGQPFSPRPSIPQNPADLELYYIARTVLSTINIALLVLLTETYVVLYIKTHSQFTIGLLIFSSVFLMKEIASSPFVVGAFRFTISGLGPFALIEPFLEMAALSVLLFLSIEY